MSIRTSQVGCYSGRGTPSGRYHKKKTKRNILENTCERQLKQTIDDLCRFNTLIVGRKLRMIELKREMNALLEQAEKMEKYRIKE